MDAQGISHPNVEVGFHKSDDGSRYFFGVILHGEFIPLLEQKAGRVEKWMLRGKEREAQNPPASSSDATQAPTQ